MRFGRLTRFLVLPLLALACASPIPAESDKTSRSPAAGHLDRSVLEDPGRPEEERKQDKARKSLDLYEWLGIQPGMTVADLWPGKGYNTHLLSLLAGDAGNVVAVWHWYGSDVFGPDYNHRAAFEERARTQGLDNLTMAAEFSDVPDNSVDVALTVRNYHDLWMREEWNPLDFVREIYRFLKPGGIVGIVEVATPNEGWHNETHRLNENVVMDHFTSVGFVPAGRSDMLANPDDDHTTQGFPDRHLADQYVLKFRKPISKKGSRVSTLTETLVGGASSIAIDKKGNLYVASWSKRVYKVHPSGRAEVFADDLEGTTGNAMDAEGNLYQANFFNNSITRIDREGNKVTLAEGLAQPVGLALSGDSLFVSNCESNTVSRVTLKGEVTTFATSSEFNCPNGITRAADGNLYLANFWDRKLFRITPQGHVSHFVTVPQDRNMIASVGTHLYITSPAGKRVYRISTTTGEVTHIAGTGEAEERDGAALQAAFSNPNGIAVSPDESYLIISNVVAEEPAPGKFTVRRISLAR